MTEEFTGERWIPGTEGDIALEHMHRYRFALQLAGGKRVLDIACGEGYGSSLLATEASHVVGVDIDEQVVERARQRYERGNLTFVPGTCWNVPLPDHSVELVVSFETLEHHDRHGEMMREIKRLLTSDGLLVVSSPDKYEYSELPGTDNPFHVKELYRHEFAELINDHFAKHLVLGQRILYGSAILGECRSEVETLNLKEPLDQSAGLARPLYLIALATDGEVPSFRTGLLEMPAYESSGYKDLARQVATWTSRASELTEHVGEAERKVHALGQRLSRRVASRKKQAQAIRSLREQNRALAQDNAKSGVAIDLLSEEISDLKQAQWSVLESLLERQNEIRESVQASVESADLASALTRRLESVESLNQQLQTDVQGYREAHRAIMRSRSWKITKPLRVSANLLRVVIRRPHELTNAGTEVSRAIWRQLPIGAQTRSRAHVWFRRWFPRRYYSMVGAPAARLAEPCDGPPDTPPAEDGLQHTRTIQDSVYNGRAPANDDWNDYSAVIHTHLLRRQQRLVDVETAHCRILDLSDREIEDAIQSLSFPVSSSPTVSIVIPVFNNLKLTVECLVALRSSTPAKIQYEVIIADDASTDPAVERLRGIPGLHYLRQPENLGFLLNAAKAAALARGEILVFLNNDVQTTHGWLGHLVSAIRSDDRVAATGPKFLYPDGRLQEAGASVNPDASSTMIGLFDDPTLPQYNWKREVDYCSGACLAVTREAFFEAGGFSPDLSPAYCEDLELGLKLSSLGYKTLYCPDSVVVHHLSATIGSGGQAAKERQIARNQQIVIDRWGRDIELRNDVKILAFYLPQFHPIPENDVWWGAGFTEWRNVAKAQPNFVGHLQPRVPADLGYYDLRAVEVMEMQAEMARRFGVYGFCFYYYWFGGKKLLDMPIERMLVTGRPDIPFCLCWANENWTRRWDGRDRDLLVGQSHSAEDDVRVIDDLCRFFQHPNYIRAGGKPAILVYRVDQFPNFRKTSERWRRRCREVGLGDIYIVAVESFAQSGRAVPPSEYACDAVAEFPPHNFGVPVAPPGEKTNPSFEGAIYDYKAMVDLYLQREGVPYTRFRGVMPGWDNTPRRQDYSHTFVGGSPGIFQAWLEITIQQTREWLPADERFIFVNAWNEWAEGAYLEPDTAYGYRWLESVANAKQAELLERRR